MITRQEALTRRSVGYGALAHNTGNSNTGLGNAAGLLATNGDGNVYIGANLFGVAGEANPTYIRNVYDSQATARIVYVNSNNKIGTLSSSRRYKEDITSMDKASEALLALKPVTFRYKKEIDQAQALSFGLIAEGCPAGGQQSLKQPPGNKLNKKNEQGCETTRL